MIDTTLYDAFGQRQVSTIYTRAEPVPRGDGGRRRATGRARRRCESIYVRVAERRAGAAVGARALRADERRRCRSTTRASSRRRPSRSTCAGRVARRGGRRRSTTTMARIGVPASDPRQLPGHRAQAFQASLANQPLLILAALVAVYIVLGILYESYIHPLTILSTLPSAGVGALLALLLFEHRAQRHRADRHHPADRHREEERDHDDRLRARRPSAREGKSPRGGDLRGVPAALPADHDDDDGGAARRAAARARHRRRRRAAPAARHRDRRRPAREPAADAVHDAGGLPVSRSLPAVVPAGRWRAARGRADHVSRRRDGASEATCAARRSGAWHAGAARAACAVGPDYVRPRRRSPDGVQGSSAAPWKPARARATRRARRQVVGDLRRPAAQRARGARRRRRTRRSRRPKRATRRRGRSSAGARRAISRRSA